MALCRGFSRVATLECLPTQIFIRERSSAIELIDKIMSCRLDVPEEELRRLQASPRIDRSLQKISSAYSERKLNLAEKIAIGQSIELREKLKDKYYVINHGQNNAGAITNIVAKKVTELFEAKKQKYFEVLRHDVFLQGIPKDRDVDWYRNELGKWPLKGGYPEVPGLEGSPNMKMGGRDYMVITDHNYVTELICADIDLERTEVAESAISFFVEATNIAVRKDPGFTKETIYKIAKRYFPCEKLCKQISRKISTASFDLTGGTLYSICIPKDRFESVAYPSQAYGFSAGNVDLHSLQEGTSSINGIQVRLLTTKLTEENEVLIIPHSTLSKEKIREVESVVERCLSPATFDRLWAKFE